MEYLNKYNDMPLDLESLSKSIVDCVFKVHKNLGPGFLERIYEECLCIEFENRGILYTRQFPVEVSYEGKKINTDFRLDIVVENKILIELKAVEKMNPVYQSQIYSYLKMSDLPMGFLVNFNTPLIKDGIQRIINKNFASSKLRAI